MKNRREINLFDYILNTFLSIFPTLYFYQFLNSKVTYTNLNDLYVGTSIYLNYNKYIDIIICFVYIALFFILLPISIKIINLFSNANFNFIDRLKPIEIPILDKLKKYQFWGLSGYFLLYPFNDEIIYKNLIILILILITIGFIDIRKRQNKTFSPFAIAPILFMFYYLFYNYSNIVAPSDDHHYGEQIATYYLHTKYNMQYYKDLMLVHGFLDVIPSFLGDFFFDEITIKSSMLGYTLYNHLIVLITFICGLFLFSENLIFVVPILFTAPHLSLVFFTSLLILMTKRINEKPLIWLIIYSVLMTLFMLTWTTIGSFCFISSFPFAIYMLHKLIKNNTKNLKIKIIELLVLTLIIFSIFYFTKDIISAYLVQASYYVKGNLYAFGNNFGKYDYSVSQTIYYTIRLFAILVCPYIIIKLIQELKEKEKNLNEIFKIIFLILFPLVSLSYTLGRIDAENFSRICNISTTYLCLVIPFFLYKEKNNTKAKTFFMQILLIIAVIATGINAYKNTKKTINQQYYNKTKINNAGNIKFDIIDEKRITNLINFVETNSKNDDVYLDLTNRGMNYMYTDKKMPIPYTSYYNIISSSQNEKIFDQIQKNEPKIILIGFYKEKENIASPIFDKIYPSLRINKLYRWMLLSKKYKLIKQNGNIYLLKTNEKIEYSQEEKNTLDEILSNKELNYLPEAWGNSLSNLPIEKVELKHRTEINDNNLSIIFEEKHNGGEIQLIHLNNLSGKEYKIKINNLNTSFSFKTKSNQNVLVPFDNLPTFLLEENIKKINIEADNKINKDTKITFYKRM